MVEAEASDTSFTFKPPSSYLDSDLVHELKRLFSLENLEKDYCMVMSMNHDLWVSLNFVLNLESIKTICKTDLDLLCACYQAGLELSNGFVRNKVEIPRKVVYVHDCEAFQEKLQDIKCKKATKEGKNWVLHFLSESEALNALDHLKSLDYDCGLDYANPYVYLLSSVNNYMKENSFYVINSLFFKSVKKVVVYSLEDMKEMYAKSNVTMPREFKKLASMNFIKKVPREIEILTN